MKKLLGVVKNNLDTEYQKRIQASIIGLTDAIPPANLPWAFPLDDQCIVPDNNKKVWIYVNQSQKSEDYDYNKLYYERFEEETFKECYSLNTSDSYLKRLSKKKLLQPTDVTSTTYPTNKVVKLSNITVEFDGTNKRFCITDESGNSLAFLPTGKVERVVANSYTGIDGTNTIDTTGGTNILGGSGASEPMTLGSTLDSFLISFRTFVESFVIWAGTHVHVETGTTTLVPTVPPPTPVPIKPIILSTLNKNN